MVKIAALVVLNSFMLTFAVLAAYMLRMSEIALPPHGIILLLLLGPVLSVASAGLFGVYLSITRLRAQGSDTPIILSQAPVVLVWSLFVVVMGEGFPRSVVLIFAIFAPVVMISSRRLIAAVLGDRALFVSERRGVPTVILGAGSVGAELLVSLRGRDDHEIVAFVETDAKFRRGISREKENRRIDGPPGSDRIHRRPRGLRREEELFPRRSSQACRVSAPLPRNAQGRARP